MEEKQLELKFKDFLLNRNYSENNLLSQVALRTQGSAVFRPDLVILDLTNKEYIAIIEFKANVDDKIKINTLGKFYKYFSLLGTQAIPAYLVFPLGEDDFQILYLSKENSFQPITKEEFPSFEALSAKRLTEEKISQREVEEKTLFELERKKKNFKQSSYFAILSIVIGASFSIFSIFSQQKIFRQNTTPIQCCDSLIALKNQYQLIILRLNKIEHKLSDSLNSKNDKDTVYINSTELLNINKRVKNIEDGISSDPEKTLSIVDVRHEIELLKKSEEYSKDLNQSKIDNLKEEISIQNSWMVGLLIAIFGSIFSLIIPNILPRKSDLLIK